MSGNSLAMMPWFPGDFMRSTRGWSVTSKGVYRELLDAQWDMGELPADPEELAALISATTAEWQKGWGKCAPKFPIGHDGMRRNPRLESHRTKSADLTERRQKGAAITNAGRGAKRTLNGSHSDALSDADSARTAERPAHASDPIHSESVSDPNRAIPENPPPTPSRGRVRGERKRREEPESDWIPPTEEQIRAGN
jgi:uncharacterized protein YdaU (DUF1376 family)